MDFLKSTLTSALSKGPPFPYAFLDRVGTCGVFTLHNGTKREDGSACSIFTFEINSSSNNRAPLAKNALRKLRTLRHPGCVRVLESVETDTYIYIATERVRPLSWHVECGVIQAETAKWGLWSVAAAIKFINEEAKSIHGAVRMDSVYTSESGEWKLAGFEVLSSAADDDPFIYRYGGLLPDANRYCAPEVGKGGWDGLKSLPIHATDSYGFAALMYESFNGPLTSTDQLPQPKKIPPVMVAAYKRLINANPKSRLSVAHFLEQGLHPRSFFDIPLIHISEFVANMGVKSQSERETFLDELERTGDQFPQDYFKMKILPELLKSVEFGGGGPKVFDAVLRIGEKLSEEEWEGSITPAVVRLFSLPDRATRVFLLDNLGRMIEHLSSRVVNDKIFPDMLTGFSDSAPLVREQTVKAVLTIITKLSDRNTNGDLLKHLAKTQNDEQPGIRTNTTICLGKIAKHLGQNTRQKVLTAAFTRSLRDPFLHGRNAALLALSATCDLFNETDCATKLVPAIASVLVDKEGVVRTQAQKTLDQYLAHIRILTANYPDTEQTPAVAGAATVVPGREEAGSWAGWAISSFTKKVASGDISRGKSPLPPTEDRPSSAPVMDAPVRPTPRTATSTNALPSAAAQEPGGFLEEDDDDVDGWGALDEPPPQPRESQPTTAADPWGQSVSTQNGPVRNTLGTRTKPSGVSQFGPKPFTLTEEEVDFEALVGGKKKSAPLPKGLGKKAPVKRTAPVKKAVVAKTEKKKAWDDEEGDWGEGW